MYFPMKNKKIVLLVMAFAAFILGSAFGLKSCGDQQKQEAAPINLTYWRLWDERDTFSPLIEAYQKENPNVTITYRKLTLNEYEKAIIDALASGKGPDIWTIHNTWLPKHLDKLEPAPESLLNLTDYQNTFVEVASNDFVNDNKVYAIPLSVDTLALYYNKDFFNTAFIVAPPANWNEFEEDVIKLTKTDELGQISKSAVAMGSAGNVNRAPDILSLLMLQNGTEMVNAGRSAATFNLSAENRQGEAYFPGLQALKFYTDYANPKKEVYTWTPTNTSSIEAFIGEETAMMFNYSYQAATIRAKAPKLNFGIARVPQIKDSTKEVNYANYWAEVVSKSSPNKEEAWKFLTFLAKKENAKNYAEITKRPGARKDVLKDQLDNPELKIFATQALTAKSWFQIDSAAVDNIFNKMIETVVLGENEPEDALSSANQQVTALLQGREQNNQP